MARGCWPSGTGSGGPGGSTSQEVSDMSRTRSGPRSSEAGFLGNSWESERAARWQPLLTHRIVWLRGPAITEIEQPDLSG
jgi:hypothetical protein